MTPRDFIQKIDAFYAASQFNELEAFLLNQLKQTDVSNSTFRIMVLNEIGTYYRGSTRFDKAILYFQKALDELEETVGKNSIDYATAVNNLGGAYRMHGQYNLARACFEEANQIYAQYQNQNPMLYASGINNLALLDLAVGDYESAIPALQNALAIMSTHPRYKWEQATTICNLGICMLHTKQLEQAEKYLCQAHDMISSMNDSQQGHLAAVQKALGDLYIKRNDKDNALAAFLSAKNLILKHYGKNRDYDQVCQIIDYLKEQQKY